MFAHKDATKETFLDLNLKVYREMDFGRLWAGLSYRNSFDGAEYLDSEDQIKTQKLNLDDDFDLDWLPDQIDGFVYLPGTINLRPFKGIKPSSFIDDFNINVMGCVKICLLYTSPSPRD